MIATGASHGGRQSAARRNQSVPMKAELLPGSPSALAEQHATLRLVIARAFYDLDQHRVRGHVKVLYHRIGNVLDQSALLLLGTPLDGMDIDFGHFLSSSV